MTTTPRRRPRTPRRAAAVTGACALLTASLVAGATPLGLGFSTPASAAPSAAARSWDPLTNVSAFATPPKDAKPMMRWWWAAPLSSTEAITELTHLEDAGFGGAEIAYDAGSWATPEQRQVLADAIAWAKSHDFELDMTIGASWPVSTPATTAANGASELEIQYGRADATGGTFSGPVPTAYDNVTDRAATLVAVTAAKVTTRGPAVTTANTPPATSTVLDPSSLVDLTDRVSNGNLSWTAPDGGDWVVFAFWSRPTAEGVNGVASLFDKDSIDAATGYVGDRQLGAANKAALPGVGGAYFEDSLENNATSQYWTPDMLAQFQQRRGYDLTKYLPLVFLQGMSQYAFQFTRTGQLDDLSPADFTLPDNGGQRVLNDYWTTLGDLYQDEHVKPLVDWAAQTGMQYRTQGAYGESLNTSRAGRDIAEAGGLMDDESLNAGGWDSDQVLSANEGSWRFMVDHYRSAVGGSNQGGQTQVSTELGAAIPALETTMRSYQQLMDTSWAMGITRPIVHGYAYQADGASWPGTSRFSNIVAESWNADTFPQWEDWKPLADYWSRGTYVLQSGTARSDVAVLYDGFLTSAATSSLGGGAPVPALFDGLSAETRGYQLQYVDSQGLTDANAGNRGVLFPNGPAYKALVIHQSSIDPDAAEALATQAEKGLAGVIVGNAPSTSSSYGADPAAANARVTAAMRRILAAPSTRQVATESAVGAALDRLGVRPDTQWSTGDQLYAQHRETAASDLYYVYNPTTKPITTTISFKASGSPRELDLWTGAETPVATYDRTGDRVAVPVTLAPGENTVLGFPKNTDDAGVHVTSTGGSTDVAFAGNGFAVSNTAAGAHTLTLSDGRSATVTTPALPAALRASSWDLHVQATGPEADQPTYDLSNVALTDWRDIAELKDVAGVGTYTSTISLPAGWTAADRGTYLDLGDVAGGSVKVYVNGSLATPAVTALTKVDISSLLKPGANDLKVVFRSTLRNKATALNIGTLTGPATQATGLVGPVQLIPFSRQTITPTGTTTPTLASTRIQKLGQSPKKVTAGKRFALRLWVSSPAGGQPSGTVRVLRKGKQVGIARVSAGLATVKVRLTRSTRPGHVKLVLAYGGDASFQPSQATTKVAVKKKHHR